jgi:hypothetical protein
VDAAKISDAKVDDTFLQKLKKEVPELLNLVMMLQCNFEGEDATKQTKNFHKRVKERETKERQRQRATLFIVDAYLCEQEQIGKSGEEVEERQGFIGVEEALHAAAEASDNNDNNNFRYSDWKQDVGERARRIYDWWRVVMNEKEVFQHFRRQLELLPQPMFQVLQLSEYSLSLLSFAGS